MNLFGKIATGLGGIVVVGLGVVFFLQPNGDGIERVSFNRKALTTSIDIDATPAQVWSVMTDFETMPSWSSTFKGMAGTIEDGAEVDVVYVVGETTYDLVHTIGYKEGEYYSWSDPTVAGMNDNHFFRVTERENGNARFVHSDETIGGIAWLAGGHMLNLERDSFRIFNAELKAEVERRIAEGELTTQDN